MIPVILAFFMSPEGFERLDQVVPQSEEGQEDPDSDASEAAGSPDHVLHDQKGMSVSEPD